MHPQHVLAVYVESLAIDAHVAVFGDASVGLGARLVELGARAVHVYDPDERRALAEADRAPRGVAVQPYTGDEPVRPVDLAVVSDLSLFAAADDLVARVRAMVGDDGVAVVAAANRDYYELFDLMAREFEGVRMVAELPFHGVALVELGGDDELPAVSVDTQLADREREPEAFVVVASQSDVRLDAYAIVELPASTPPAPVQAPAPARPVEPPSPDPALVQQVVELSARLDEMRVAAEAGRAAAEAGRAAAARAEESARRADLAERRAGALEHELSRVGEAHASELARFEDALRERAQAVRTLESEMARRERMVRDLAGVLDEAHAAAPAPRAGAHAPAPRAEVSAPAPEREQALAEENAHLCARLDALALELARREGESHATAWNVAELERRLEQAPQAPSKPGAGAEDLTVELRAALDELDVLRLAMAREHAARVAVEGGEALVTARAEVERQAVLLDQMTRELQTRGLAGNSR